MNTSNINPHTYMEKNTRDPSLSHRNKRWARGGESGIFERETAKLSTIEFFLSISEDDRVLITVVKTADDDKCAWYKHLG